MESKGLEDKVIGTRYDFIELEQQAWVRDMIEGQNTSRKGPLQYCPRSRDVEIMFTMQKHCCSVEWEVRKPNWWEGIMPWETNIGRNYSI
jgi:hypothetical protein